MSTAGESPSGSILLVDDDRELAAMVATLVERAGHTPLLASEPTSALELFESQRPLVAVIDLNLEHGDGFSLLAELRRRSAALPIIVLTGRLSEDDKIRAFDAGADDYIVKPFAHRELLARIRAQIRHAMMFRELPQPAFLQVGPLRLDLREQTLARNGETVRLTGTEFRLMQYLMRHRDAVVPTAALARHVWGYDDAATRDVVRVTVHRLRRKLGESAQHRLIHTVPGVGLRLQTG